MKNNVSDFENWQNNTVDFLLDLVNLCWQGNFDAAQIYFLHSDWTNQPFPNSLHYLTDDNLIFCYKSLKMHKDFLDSLCMPMLQLLFFCVDKHNQ